MLQTAAHSSAFAESTNLSALKPVKNAKETVQTKGNKTRVQ